MAYKWDTKLLRKYSFNPEIRRDLEALYFALNDKNNGDDLYLSKDQVAARNSIYFEAHDFAQAVLEEASQVPGKRDEYDIKKPRTNITVSDALKQTRAFYTSIPDTEIRSAFLAMYNIRNGRLRTLPPRKNLRYGGHTYTTAAGKDYFMDILATNDFTMLTTLIHEFGHVLGFRLRDFQDLSYKADFFGEVESIFMEMLAQEYFLKHGSYVGAIKHTQIACYVDLIDDINELLDKMDFNEVVTRLINDEFGAGLDLTWPQMYRLASKETGIPLNRIKQNLKYPADEDLPYVLSRLIAIELLAIYRQDPNTALDIYKRILTMPDAEPPVLYNNICKFGITPCEHLDELKRSLK